MFDRFFYYQAPIAALALGAALIATPSLAQQQRFITIGTGGVTGVTTRSAAQSAA